MAEDSQPSTSGTQPERQIRDTTESKRKIGPMRIRTSTHFICTFRLSSPLAEMIPENATEGSHSIKGKCVENVDDYLKTFFDEFYNKDVYNLREEIKTDGKLKKRTSSKRIVWLSGGNYVFHSMRDEIVGVLVMCTHHKNNEVTLSECPP